MRFVLFVCTVLCTIAFFVKNLNAKDLPKKSAQIPYKKLSQYKFFRGHIGKHIPVKGVTPYDINTPLFSDYTFKRRFIYLPPGTKMLYQPVQSFDFPNGAILIKTFSLPYDMRKPHQERLLETRLLVKQKGKWLSYPYIWNETQTDAILEEVGDYIDVSWVDKNGKKRENEYLVPNVNECKKCHSHSDQLVPIGIKAKHLNRHFVYTTGNKNQLEHWSALKILQNAPKASKAPRLAIWNNKKSGTLEQRARAYLDINCAHCHSPKGPANNSGLDLRSEQTKLTEIGIYKAPVAAGRGSGGHEYDIVPGKPEASILLYRMNSVEPEIAMPELGRGLVHKEGVELIRQWIKNIPDK